MSSRSEVVAYWTVEYREPDWPCWTVQTATYHSRDLADMWADACREAAPRYEYRVRPHMVPAEVVRLFDSPAPMAGQLEAFNPDESESA